MPPVSLAPPERLIRTVSAWEGDEGRAWLERLPGLVREFVDRWELEPERVVEPGGNISMVVLVRRADGTQAALKIGMVTPETADEPAALARWNGHGAVRLLDAEPAAGALLLERLQGDVSLRSLPEPKAMLEAADVLQRLWVEPGGHRFTTVGEYVAHLAHRLRDRCTRLAPHGVRPLVQEALRLQADLLASSPEQVMLHGDFHHGNVLRAGPQSAGGLPWRAIDPKPLVGERAYDLAWLVRDRLATLAGSPGPAAKARRRVDELADTLEVDRERLRGWALFRAVEAGLWSLSVGDRKHGELLLEFAGWL